jgi:hypothetical protein
MLLTPFERGLVAHLVADWLLQNDWMAKHKSNLRHPAGWTHAAVHVILTGWALGWTGGLVLGGLHLLIDTGWPMQWWIKVFKKCEGTPHAVLIRIATDQALHIALLAAWIDFF